MKRIRIFIFVMLLGGVFAANAAPWEHVLTDHPLAQTVLDEKPEAFKEIFLNRIVDNVRSGITIVAFDMQERDSQDTLLFLMAKVKSHRREFAQLMRWVVIEAAKYENFSWVFEKITSYRNKQGLSLADIIKEAKNRPASQFLSSLQQVEEQRQRRYRRNQRLLESLTMAENGESSFTPMALARICESALGGNTIASLKREQKRLRGRWMPDKWRIESPQLF